MFARLFLILVSAWRFSSSVVDCLIGVDVYTASLNMVLRYTSRQLLCLKRNYYLSKDTYACCGNADLLRPKRYIHQSSGCSFTPSSLIQILNSQRKNKRLSHSGAVSGNLLSLPCVGWNSSA